MEEIKLPRNRTAVSYKIVDPAEYFEGKAKKIITYIAIGAALYGAFTIPNSIKVTNELDSLSKKFAETAQKDKPDSTFITLNYDGKLDEIINERNAFAKYNSAINFGEWNAAAVEKGKIRTTIEQNAWCWNPFKKIVSFKNWSESRKAS